MVPDSLAPAFSTIQSAEACTELGAFGHEIPIADLCNQVYPVLAELVRGRCQLGAVSLLCPRKTGADNPLKLLVSATSGQPVAVIHCSTRVSPKLVERGQTNIRTVREKLPEDLAAPILEPLLSGRVDGLSFVLSPYCRALSRSRLGWFMQRRGLASRVWRWLVGAARATVHAPKPRETRERVERPLEYMTACQPMTPQIRQAADHALQRLRAGRWRPHLTLVHNDFWKDNILLPDPRSPLLPPAGSRPAFYIIDWAGASMEGHGIYDVARFARSFALPRRLLRALLDDYCAVLGCDPADTVSALLAALGCIGLDIEHFPLDRFIQLSRVCYESVVQAIEPAWPQAHAAPR